MIRKLSAFLLLTVSASGIAYAQQTIEPLGGQTSRNVTGFVLNDAFGGGYLGVQTLDVTRENFAKYGLREVRGVAVEKVVKDSPAARAGLQNGDVIVRFNGEEVTSVFKLTRLINETAPDHQAKITVSRGGAESELTATLAKRQTPTLANGAFGLGAPPPGNFEFPRTPLPPAGSFTIPYDGSLPFSFGGANRQIGVGVTAVGKQLADYFGVPGGTGLLIDNVRANSPAARAGLKAGDLIVEADGKAIKTNVDLIRALNDKKDGDITLTVVRDKNRQTITVTPEVSKAAPAAPFGVFENFDENGDQSTRFRLQTPTAPLPPLKFPARVL